MSLFRFGSAGRFTKTVIAVGGLLVASLATGPNPAAAAGGIEGRWQGPDGGIIQIANSCDGLCGRVDTSPDPSIAAGTQMTSVLTPAGSSRWTGQIHAIKRGQWIDAEMSLADADTLVMKGCMMGGLVCRERVMKRVSE